MTIQEFIDRRGITYRQAADELGVAVSTVHRHAHRQRFPNPVMVARYREWSKGKITLVGIYGDARGAT